MPVLLKIQIFRMFGCLFLHCRQNVRINVKVKTTVECPSLSLTTFGLTFFSSKNVAVECLGS